MGPRSTQLCDREQAKLSEHPARVRRPHGAIAGFVKECRQSVQRGRGCRAARHG